MIKKLMQWAMIITSLFCATSSFGAIASNCVLDISITGGDNSNGGGYNSYRGSPYIGTDYSNQDAAQDTYTTLECAASATKLFLGGAETFNQYATGNLIQIYGGTNFSLGFYEITSIASSQAVNIDRSANSGSFASSGRGKMGGRLRDLLISYQSTSPIVAGNIVYIKDGTYTRIGSAGAILSTTTAGVVWEGYKTTRGDSPTGDDRPEIDGAGVTANPMSGGGAFAVKNLIIKRGTDHGINITSNPTGLTFVNCKISNHANGGFQDDGYGGGFTYNNCEISNNTGAGSNSSNQAPSWVYNTYVHNNTGAGISLGTLGNAVSAFNSIFESNGSHGISTQLGAGFFTNCIFYNNTGASTDGININTTSTNRRAIIQNSIFESNGRNGVRAGINTTCGLFDYNCYSGNASADLFNISPGNNDINSNSIMNSPVDGDFTFKTGSPCIGSGYPFPYATSPVATYFWNIGLDQGDHKTLSAGSVS